MIASDSPALVKRLAELGRTIGSGPFPPQSADIKVRNLRRQGDTLWVELSDYYWATMGLVEIDLPTGTVRTLRMDLLQQRQDRLANELDLIKHPPATQAAAPGSITR